MRVCACIYRPFLEFCLMLRGVGRLHAMSPIYWKGAIFWTSYYVIDHSLRFCSYTCWSSSDCINNCLMQLRICWSAFWIFPAISYPFCCKYNLGSVSACDSGESVGKGAGARGILQELDGWKCQRIGLQGLVRNRTDGSVEALFSGGSERVEEMEQCCRRRPQAVMSWWLVFRSSPYWWSRDRVWA